MPIPIHLLVEGVKQGKIEGSCTMKGREGTILVQGVDHTVEIPKSPQTGLPTGKRVHMPMTITKEMDKSSPKLFQALCSGEQLKTVELDFYRISPQGTEEKYYTIKLANAIVTAMRTYFPNCLEQATKSYGHMEDIAFTYEKIVATWVPDGIEAEDDWTAPK
ncbi:MAG TPA: Hcp family type VI secretion system effector [Acidobacteriota bacterium]|nr:Hcp family type VI secretion system effector [Acidobacteriota bacterium]HNT99355.1 Hcp family type VI secretion system effector [Acidobacteriota bacterium]HOB52060.1 Hcp family type VI secretion system effector [Acidobacteriota bacterium]HQM62579.1 Hcp family type VI secretion system effector [Acidobacteriota bacterium]